jgi:hypothetical protein
MMTVPVSGDIRQARKEAARVITPRLSRLRDPTLAALGLLTAFADPATMTGAPGLATYDELIYRGRAAAQFFGEQREVRTALHQVKRTTDQLVKAVDTAADELNDATEEALGRVSLSIYAGREYALGSCVRAATGLWRLWPSVFGLGHR